MFCPLKRLCLGFEIGKHCLLFGEAGLPGLSRVCPVSLAVLLRVAARVGCGARWDRPAPSPRYPYSSPTLLLTLVPI